MNVYQFALYFWSAVLVAVIAAPLTLALVDSMVRHVAATQRHRGDDRDSHPSLPSIPSWPSSPA
jgi:hypothetical protein